MSTIGKVFVVINLLLAGVFVGFAATYLDQAADYKTQYNETQTALEEANTRHAAALQAESTRAQGLDAKLSQSVSTLKRAETTNSELRDENTRLANQLAQLEGSLATMKSDLGTISATIKASSDQFAEKTQIALAAVAEKDNAVREKSTAMADLADANNTISALREQIEAKELMIAKAQDTIRENKIVLNEFERRFPGAVPKIAQPSLSGAVQHVSGDLVTVVVTDNPTDSEIRPGYSFAIANGSSYKGEAYVTEVAGNTAFCRMSVKAGDVSVGDRAETQTY